MKKNIALMAVTGILTLASCSQGPDADKTAPTVSLSANPTSLAKEGGSTTLTASASDNVGVTKVEFYRDGTKIGEDTTAPYTYTDNLPANTTTTAKSYSYTAKASDAANNSATSSAVSVSVAGTTGTTPTDPGDGTYSLAITSPANGATVGNNVQLQYTFNGLTDLQCGIEGKLVAPSNPGSSSGACNIDLSGVANGPVKLVVTGKDSKGTVRTAFVTVSKSIAAPSNPQIVEGISFDSTQELKRSERGLYGETKDASGRWSNVESGWRYMGQAISTPESPNKLYPVYVKGKNLKVTFTNPGGNANLIEAFYVRTTGSKTPTADDVQAAQKIQTSSNSSTLSFVYDTTRTAEFESTLQWIVIRVNGTTLYTRPVVTDNHAPQPAVANFAKGSGDSNILPGDEYVSVLGTPYTWARGNVHIFTANTQLEDNLYGPAPVGSTPSYRIPAGFESVTYYMVPDADAQKIVSSDANAERRAAMVRQYATTWTKPVLGAKDGVDGSADFRVDFNSKEGYEGRKPVEGVVYRVYAITRDQLGNDVASPTVRAIRFDNTGPVITGASLCDISPLPYVSTEPCKYISDVAAVRIGGITDAGVGVSRGTYSVNLGSYPIATLDNAGNIVWSGIAPDGILDTNVLSDGKLPFNFSRATDLLGNPAATVPTGEVVIDNTDPTLDLHSPMNGVYNSGERITSESLAKDANVDASGVYQNVLFWDDTEVAAGTTTNAQGINRAVEFARTTAPYAERTLNLSNNRDFLAPYNANVGGTQKYYVTNVAIDRAGNAVMTRNQITVKAKYSGLTNPTLGRSDAYDKFRTMNLGATNPFTINPVGANGTDISWGVRNGRISLAGNGTGTTNSGPSSIPSNTGAESLKAVTFYGQYNFQDWDKIVNYLTGDVANQQQYYDTAIAAIRAGTLQDQRAAVRLLLLVMRDRTLTAEERAELIAAGFSATQIDAAYADGFITPFVPGSEPNTNVDALDEAGLRALFPGTEANTLINTMINRSNAMRDRVITNIATLFIDPSLAAQGRSGLQNTRTQVEGWNETAQPWMRLGESTTTASLYGIDTDLVNNLYFMQDKVAVSVPDTRYYHSWLSPYYSTVGVAGLYDAVTGIAQDTAGTYNAFGEFVKK